MEGYEEHDGDPIMRSLIVEIVEGSGLSDPANDGTDAYVILSLGDEPLLEMDAIGDVSLPTRYTCVQVGGSN